jgi:hypothetical protein
MTQRQIVVLVSLVTWVAMWGGTFAALRVGLFGSQLATVQVTVLKLLGFLGGAVIWTATCVWLVDAWRQGWTRGKAKRAEREKR